MRIFAVSDVHIDYEVNARWVEGLSLADYQKDVLILAGDVSDTLARLDWCLTTLAARFKKVLFVPGNHELWVIRETGSKNSLEKFDDVHAVVRSSGASMRPFHASSVSIVPLLGWYDHSFGEPTDELKATWMDYRACRWPARFMEYDVASHFLSLNHDEPVSAAKVITYSHFLPRIDVMPSFMPPAGRVLYPVLGARRLDYALRAIGSTLHVYGHSHVNRKLAIDGVTYVNNAFGYPSETWIERKGLACIHEC